MSELVRLSISIEKSLYEQLEGLVSESGYENRSEFIRDLIREQLVKREWKYNRDVVGTLTLVYNHHTHGLSEKLTELQHDHHSEILATTHVHLDAHHCVEVTLMRGAARRLQRIADRLRRQKGVLHAALNMSSTGAELH
ncbi:MAG: nickel-responsive transcriptional regulator NikR [Kiritimatiellaeota bacterium]|nr:nickel-responsive transcriptional regulator NikR [Kiritimatiellota bacterium]